MLTMSDYDRLPRRIREVLANCVNVSVAYDMWDFVENGIDDGLSHDEIIGKIKESDRVLTTCRYLERGFDFIPNPL